MTTSTTQVQIPEGYVLACTRDDVPVRGKKTVYLNDDLRLLIIACDTELHAVEDRCPQTGRSIAHGEVLGCVLRTPTTGAHYCLETGRSLGRGKLSPQSHVLRVFPLRVIDDKVYVRVG